jgi:hypothetical protein
MTPAEKRDQQDRARRYARQVLHYRIKETQACGYAVLYTWGLFGE